jgi:hypothetical protein
MKTTFKKLFSQYWILVVLVIAKFFLQYLVVNPGYELHRDEFLHLDQANHLAFGFISVPPFTSLVSKLIMLLGGGEFWVRFFPALFGALTIVVAWLIAESLGGKLWAKVMTSLALLFSVMTRLNILYQPNAFDILAWTLLFYLLIKYIQSEKPMWLYGLAVVAAMGLCNKYNLVFLLVGLAAGLLMTKQRNLFGKAPFWKALVLLTIIMLPNVIWQIIHHFPVLEHMKVLKANQLDNNSSLGFLKDQLMFVSGSILLVVAALAAFSHYKPFREYRFAGIGIVVVLALFTALKAKNYYAFGIYPVLFAVGSVYIEQVLSKKAGRIVMPLLILSNITVFIVTANFVYPLYSPAQIRSHAEIFEKMGMLRWEDGKNHHLPQDFADMLGWEEMATKAYKAYQLIPKEEQKNTLVFADNYGQAGALNYYNRKSSMPEAYSFSTDYIFWIPQMECIRHVVLVGDEPDETIKALFSEVIRVDAVTNEYAREKGTGIYLLKGAKAEFTKGFYDLRDERISTNDIF